METKLLIGGEFAAGTGAGETILNPATGETVATVPEAGGEQVDAAVAAAREAFASWSVTAPA